MSKNIVAHRFQAAWRLRRLKRRQTRGHAGEWLAAVYLVLHGYKIISRNFRCRWGELDIVALLGRTLVVVEVKTRHNKTALQDPLNQEKQLALTRSADEFQKVYRRKLRGLRISKVRIDLVVVRHCGGVFRYWVSEHLVGEI